MPINSFEGETFVAFTDISGFKNLMKEGSAPDALDRLYQIGYETLQGNDQIEGLFVSDCGILFARDTENHEDAFLRMLKISRKINERMLVHDYMLTTSIAFGQFKYENRIEFPGIQKSPAYGNAYLAAYLDNETVKPAIQPGQCRIIKKKLPHEIETICKNKHYTSTDSHNKLLELIQPRGRDVDHYYFYWMVNNPIEIENFEKQYNNSYALKYSGMLKALKNRNSSIH